MLFYVLFIPTHHYLSQHLGVARSSALFLLNYYLVSIFTIFDMFLCQGHLVPSRTLHHFYSILQVLFEYATISLRQFVFGKMHHHLSRSHSTEYAVVMLYHAGRRSHIKSDIGFVIYVVELVGETPLRWAEACAPWCIPMTHDLAAVRITTVWSAIC